MRTLAADICPHAFQQHRTKHNDCFELYVRCVIAMLFIVHTLLKDVHSCTFNVSHWSWIKYSRCLSAHLFNKVHHRQHCKGTPQIQFKSVFMFWSVLLKSMWTYASIPILSSPIVDPPQTRIWKATVKSEPPILATFSLLNASEVGWGVKMSWGVLRSLFIELGAYRIETKFLFSIALVLSASETARASPVIVNLEGRMDNCEESCPSATSSMFDLSIGVNTTYDPRGSLEVSWKITTLVSLPTKGCSKWMIKWIY